MPQDNGPFVCASVMQPDALDFCERNDACKLPTEMHNGPLMIMERTFFKLNMTFRALLRINGTGIPTTYTVLMRTIVVFFYLGHLLVGSKTQVTHAKRHWFHCTHNQHRDHHMESNDALIRPAVVGSAAGKALQLHRHGNHECIPATFPSQQH